MFKAHLKAFPDNTIVIANSKAQARRHVVQRGYNIDEIDIVEVR